MKFDNRPEKPEAKNSLGKASGWISGLSWFVLFSVLFSDQIFGMGERGEDVALYLCIGPLFVLAVLGFILGIILSLAARGKGAQLSEEEDDYAKNGLKYGLMGIGFILIAPLINQLIEPIGIQLYDITSFFRP